MVLLNCSPSCSRQSNRLSFHINVLSVLRYCNLIFFCVIILLQLILSLYIDYCLWYSNELCFEVTVLLVVTPFFFLLLTNLQYTTLTDWKLDIWQIAFASPYLSSHKLRSEILLDVLLPHSFAVASFAIHSDDHQYIDL